MADADDYTGADETRERILQAATAVFLADGFDAARVQEIARRAGFTTGAIYANFGGKADLMAEMIAREGRLFLDLVLTSVRSGARSADTLRELGVDMLAGEPSISHQLFLEAIAVSMRHGAIRAQMEPHLTYLDTAIAAVIEGATADGDMGVDVHDAVVHFCITLALGSFVAKALELPQPSEPEARLLMAAVLRGFSLTGRDE